MPSHTIFYHAGCPVCVQAERAIVCALDPTRYRTEVVHLGEARSRIAEARSHGVVSVPALVIDGIPLHLNFGARLDDIG